MSLHIFAANLAFLLFSGPRRSRTSQCQMQEHSWCARMRSSRNKVSAPRSPCASLRSATRHVVRVTGVVGSIATVAPVIGDFAFTTTVPRHWHRCHVHHRFLRHGCYWLHCHCDPRTLKGLCPGPSGPRSFQRFFFNDLELWELKRLLRELHLRALNNFLHGLLLCDLLRLFHELPLWKLQQHAHQHIMNNDHFVIVLCRPCGPRSGAIVLSRISHLYMLLPLSLTGSRSAVVLLLLRKERPYQCLSTSTPVAFPLSPSLSHSVNNKRRGPTCDAVLTVLDRRKDQMSRAKKCQSYRPWVSQHTALKGSRIEPFPSAKSETPTV